MSNQISTTPSTDPRALNLAIGALTRVGVLKRQTVIKANMLTPHPQQERFIHSPAKRKIIRAGRRGGKTVGIAILAVMAFIAGRRVLYAAPTQEQVDRFWVTVTRILQASIDDGTLYKNETRHIIELPGTEQRIRAKTAWNADTLRGDYADLLIFDEYQLINEDAWAVVGAPMLIDNNGDAVFVYTPPSLSSRSTSKANDPQHAAKLYKKHVNDTEGGSWGTFHFSSRENPHVSQEAIAAVADDMTNLAYRMEILAEDVDESPDSLWKHEHIDAARVQRISDLDLIYVGVDPSATANGDAAGIVTAGLKGREGYVLADNTIQGSPKTWAQAAVDAYHYWKANKVIAESNNGGEMVALTIATIDPDVPVELVHASRGKATRAEPIAALYEPKADRPSRVHHVGTFAALEDEMCLWTPGDKSPNRMDAAVWVLTGLMLNKARSITVGTAPDFIQERY